MTRVWWHEAVVVISHFNIESGMERHKEQGVDRSFKAPGRGRKSKEVGNIAEASRAFRFWNLLSVVDGGKSPSDRVKGWGRIIKRTGPDEVVGCSNLSLAGALAGASPFPSSSWDHLKSRGALRGHLPMSVYPKP